LVSECTVTSAPIAFSWSWNKVYQERTTRPQPMCATKVVGERS
jgi:hypothetical protein